MRKAENPLCRRGAAQFPAVSRDIALVMDEVAAIGHVIQTIRRAAGKTIEDVKLFDLYRGASSRRGQKERACPDVPAPPTAR